MSNNYIKTLDPIQGLYDYVQDIKPYHTKIVEVLIEYVYDDDVVTIIDETLTLCWGRSMVPIVSQVWGGSPGENYVVITGDWSNALTIGELVYIGDKLYGGFCGIPVTPDPTGPGSPYLEAAEYTVVDVVVSGSPATITTIYLAATVEDNAYVPAGSFQMPGDVTAFFQFNIEDIQEDYIIVSGPATADVFSGQMIRIVDSALNDGEVMVTGSPTFNGLSTKIPVVGPLTIEPITGPAPTIIPDRYFIL